MLAETQLKIIYVVPVIFFDLFLVIIKLRKESISDRNIFGFV